MNEQGLDLQEYAAPEVPAQTEQQRQAKLNWLVKEKLFTPDEFKGMSEAELDDLLTTEFDPYYSQDIEHPERISEKGFGHSAEEVVVDLINELNLGGIHAEKTPMAEDQGKEKIDVRLLVPGGETPINLQVTTRRDEGVVTKFNRLVENTIPVILPGNILEVAKKHNLASIRSVVTDVLRQVLQGMRSRPYYRAELHALEKAFLSKDRH